MSREETITALMALFGWQDDSLTVRYAALLILCRAQGVLPPTFDDYRAGQDRK